MDYYGAYISTFRSVFVSNESVDPSIISFYHARNNSFFDHQRSVFWYQHNWFQLRPDELSEFLAWDIAAHIVERPFTVDTVPE